MVSQHANRLPLSAAASVLSLYLTLFFYSRLNYYGQSCHKRATPQSPVPGTPLPTSVARWAI